jgi:hypothetical protein
MNYENDIRIDESSLDVEWLDQASLMMRYARHSAEARKLMDEAKQDMDVIRAEIDKEIRENPEHFGIDKVTEGSIQSTILTEKRYKIKVQAYLDAKYEADMAQGAVRAFDARKDALENLVRLNGQQYFAGPKIPRDLSWERQEKQKNADANVAKVLGSKTRTRTS